MKCTLCHKKMNELKVKKTNHREGGIFYSCSNPKCNFTAWEPEKKEGDENNE